MLTCSTCHRDYSHCRCADRQRAAALRRLNASTRAMNAEIDRGNRRRTTCLTNILIYANQGDEKRARAWVIRLAAAGFDKADAARMETQPLADLAATARATLGLKAAATTAPVAPAQQPAPGGEVTP